MSRQQHGFTLLEVVIGTAIAGIVTLGALAMMTSQIEGFNRQERVSNAQMIARSAMIEITRRLRDTGFGLPPEFVIDVLPQNTLNTAAAPAACAGTDVITVRARSPRGFWTFESGSSTSQLRFSRPVAMDATVDYEWPRGTRVFVFTELGKHALVRTDATRAATALSVALKPAESAALALPGYTDVKLTSQVYAVTTTRLRLVCTDPAHPILMREDDTEAADGTPTRIPLASDIEDLQIAYYVDRDRDGRVTELDVFNDFRTANDPSLLTELDKAQAVKGVRISIVARTLGQPGVSSLPLTVEDHAPAQVPDRYVRRALRQVIMFDNRDTADPKSYLHLSNEVL